MRAIVDDGVGTRGEQRGSHDDVPPLQLHELRIGMRIVLLVPLLSSAALVLARRADVQGVRFGSVFVAVAVGAGLATLLPYGRLFRMGWGTPVVFGWSVVNLVLIAIGIWATGASSSPLIYLYALTTLFSAVAFTPGGQAVLLALTIASYSFAVGASRWNPITFAVLAVLAFLANLLVGQLKRQTAAHRRARLESERRWAVLAVVSAAARQMSAVEPLVVLRAVVDAVVALGYPRTRIYVQEDRRYRAIPHPDARENASEFIDSLRFDAVEHLLRRGKPVLVGVGDDALRGPLRRIGLSSLVLIPIDVGDHVDAILIVGAEAAPGPSPQDVEVFQMLATQAAVALENARRFERQRQSMDRIAELDQMKHDFLSNISHELRTPLTVIAGVGRTLEENSSILSEEDRRDLLVRLNANAGALDRIVAELLDFGRLNAGQLDAELVEVDLRELLDGVADRLASLFSQHGIQVDVEPRLTARADPLLMERVVENLLTNAAKYSPPGSRVTVSAIGAGREAVVAVEDDGPGIPPDELRHIGKRFFRGGHSTTRSTRGTGLGLAVVSEILDLHGTHLEVESTLGVGSRFSFRLERSPAVAGSQSMGGETTVFAPASLTQFARPFVVSDGDLPDRFETVLGAAQMGLEWSVAALFREFHPRVLRYLRAQLPDRAEELASLTWSDIASALPTFEGDEASFRRSVFAAARRRLQEARESDWPASSSTIEQEDEPSAERRAVDAALARINTLAPEQADVLLLRALGDLDVAEIAEIMGDRLNRVRAAEMEALRHLRDPADGAGGVDLAATASGMER
jgi:RNA polymerase sigma factor (sigma-70 family)